MKPSSSLASITAAFSILLYEVPQQYVAPVCTVIAACAIAAAIIQPPPPGARIEGIIYVLINGIAANVGWAVNAVRRGKTAVMVDRVQKPTATTILDKSGIPVTPTRLHLPTKLRQVIESKTSSKS
ncbi:hypothetical protein NO263_03845 [Gluconacetobacter entanii]|uniref:Uncharacterized protein n=2 Tax=Acetobacteraceae TaxID=433 RepID=A0ABQ0SG02_NOVHA|nr:MULTISPECIES: hypothetical protein [Acetobacteraceae]MCW4589709.1 hypothetical protein [Gluconacetobacter entanii]MCW4593412.1 hypothetical protein [Gluconacetobacter entanii]NPC89215.1 hypothetical protein [Gluconacetobacter entanii]GAN83856.1 hypothetical protein Gaha_0105_091 [Novacetimonas hansenii JCM 7643]GBQ62939.1 hypothetical protein AA0243_2996 [Novacetimonas hansenii NRIC 0243]